MRVGGRIVLKERFEGGVSSSPNGDARIVQLDPASALPQAVLSHFTGGAHCCTETRVATLSGEAHWRVIDAGEMDDGGFAFEDIDGDGGAELVGIDNSFLYAFASYAESNAPTRIKKLINGELKDVTQNPAYQRYLHQQVLAMEANASPESWHNNGFLAGWVAAKALIGEDTEAWSRMLLNYDHYSDWELTECVAAVPLDKCP